MMEPLAFLDGLKLGDALVAFLSALHTFAASAAPVVTTGIWQGVLVAACLALLVRLAPAVSAAQRFVIWSAGFAALVGLPFLPVLKRVNLSAPSPNVSAGATTFSPWLEFDLRWAMIIAGLWLVASIVRTVDLTAHALHLLKLWRSAVPVQEILSARCSQAPGPDAGVPASPTTSKTNTRSEARALTGVSMGTRASGPRRYDVCATPELDRPSVIGFFRPRILIPDWLYPRLTPEELQQIVLHEAEHLRRRDDWTNLLQKLCLVVFPLNPALWWIERRLCSDREMACDEAVVRLTHAPRAYAACLASLAERRVHRRAEALSLGAWGRRPDLAQRVHSILQQRGRSRSLSPAASWALLATLGGGLLAGTTELARCPQLVAFVPEHKASARQDLATNSNRDAAGLLRARYAVVPVKAVLRTPQPMTENQTGSAKSPDRPAQRSIAPNARGRRQFLSAHNQSSTDPTVTGQFIVFSAWEEVQTPASASGLIADYQTSQSIDGPAPQPTHARNQLVDAGQQTGAKRSPTTDQTPASKQPGMYPATRITIMQLIFRIDPTAAPTPDGWVVLQL